MKGDRPELDRCCEQSDRCRSILEGAGSEASGPAFQLLLVAFSCKGRGICPSCGASRMCNSAAHAVNRVLPDVPVGQYVLSLPFELRRAAAFRADVATTLGRIFMEAVACEQKRAAGLLQGQPAAMNHIQRFGGSLNLNLHFHAVVADGVFVPDDAGRVSFHETGAPSREALDRIVRRVRDRTLRWLRKKGLLEERAAEDRSSEEPERSALDACADIALRGGTFASLERAEAAQTGEAEEARFEPKHCRACEARGGATRGRAWYLTAMADAAEDLHGIVRGKLVELERDPGLPDGERSS